ncbi:hypothetical protein Vqi01_53110 [Micromonospora qiuiae]|uniref:NUDIX hydrolase n=1 Tax=Micromonospora qiuiae TaxID=502268 RepID=A0ABQ4JL08_9ACTN|nr:hypothetical protein [Micromonospora qiuiae]GIJ30149.1 hypothetical protein Vqi01_53110 [Micromonospora qiuiae]
MPTATFAADLTDVEEAAALRLVWYAHQQRPRRPPARLRWPGLRVDAAELQDARWFTRAEVVDRIVNGPGSGPADSIGGWLLRSWAGFDGSA